MAGIYKNINGEAMMFANIGGGGGSSDVALINALIDAKLNPVKDDLEELGYKFDNFVMIKSPEEYSHSFEDVIDADDVVDIVSGEYDAVNEWVTIGDGAVLEIITLPYDLDEQPNFIKISPNMSVASGATIEMFVCNNANDVNPTWEAYEPGSTHEFTNTVCLTNPWSVATRIKITRGTAVGGIVISRVATGVG